MRWGLSVIGLLLAQAELAAQSTKICALPSLAEVSGSIWHEGALWVLADGGNAAKLYRVDTSSGTFTDSTSFQNASNIDWEELSCNSTHVFIGDFGNNTGQRRNLRIFKFDIGQLGNENVYCDTLLFSYAEQADFSYNPLTIYDCEAMVAFEDSLVLFSKSWADLACRVYSLPVTKGTHKTRFLQTLQPGKLITGACKFKNRVVLCAYGYNGQFQPGLTLLELSSNPLFQNAKHIGLNVAQAVQVESIVQLDTTTLWITAEASNGSQATLYAHYEKTLGIEGLEKSIGSDFMVYPNPAQHKLHIAEKYYGIESYIYNAQGQLWKSVFDYGDGIDVSELAAGSYSLRTATADGVYTIPFWVAERE